MQGRLSPRPASRLQAFPRTTWRDEFDLAARLGFDGIEWIYEADHSAENPLISAEGRRVIREAADESGVEVMSVCADYFLVHRLSEPGAPGIAASKELARVVEATRAVGAARVVLPWLEEAAIDTDGKRATATGNLVEPLAVAERDEVAIAIEMEVDGVAYRRVIDEIAHPLVVANYDTGNSTAAGSDIASDIVALEGRIGAVHIKDRPHGGGTSRALGSGDANFRGFFRQLDAWDFDGDIILQHYFDDPVGDARRALEFVRELWPRRAPA
jgi:hexulose-6-phosphate isomerase